MGSGWKGERILRGLLLKSFWKIDYENILLWWLCLDTSLEELTLLEKVDSLRCVRILPLFVFSIADQLWMNCGLEGQRIPEPGTFLVNAQLWVMLYIPQSSVGKPLFYETIYPRYSFVFQVFSSRLQNNQLTPNVSSAVVKGLICFLFYTLGYFLLGSWSSNYIV